MIAPIHKVTLPTSNYHKYNQTWNATHYQHEESMRLSASDVAFTILMLAFFGVVFVPWLMFII